MRRSIYNAALAALILGAVACGDDQGTNPNQPPAGTWDLLFFSYAGGGIFAEALILPPNSGGFPERIFPIGRFAMDPSPSPDGSRIAYAVRNLEGYTHLWVADRDGGNARQIGTSEGGDGWPSWSPDGSRIAFHSEAVGLSDIYVVNPDGTGLQRLTWDPLPGLTSEVQPAWSPDGLRIAFSGNVHGHYDIFTMRPDGSDLRRITATPDSDLEPSWSPAGDRLAVRRVTPTQEWDIWLLKADGTQPQPVALPGWQRSPAWRADGEAIAFSSQAAPGMPWQIWTMSQSGGEVVQQTPNNSTGGHRPVWLRRR